MKRFLMFVTLCISAVISVHAQADMYKGTIHEVEYESFTSVDVSDDFIVRLVSSDKYMTRIISDKRLEKYVKAHVQNGTLYITLDRKSLSSELKKSLRAKGAPAPVLEAEISFPSINTLKLSDNAILHRSDTICSGTFTLNLGDKARVDKLRLECRTAELNLAKSSYADIEAAVAEQLFISTSNSSKIIVNQSGNGVKITTTGSSMVDAVVEAENVDVVSSGTSEVKLISGKVDVISVNASGSSKVDAESVAIPNGSMLQEGLSKCYMNVTDSLRVNLTGSSMLTFKNKPYIDVERIVGSTLIKADDPKRK